MDKFYDVHCHLFTKDLLSEDITKFLAFIRASEIIKSLDKNRKTDQTFKSFTSFTNLGLSKDPSDIFNTMKNSYPGKWAFSPLMLDLKYTFIEEKYKSKDSIISKGKEQISVWTSEWETAFNKYINNDKENRKWLLDLNTSVTNFFDHFEKSREKEIPQIENNSSEFINEKTFSRQIDALQKLKKRFPDEIFPFIGIDPRREREDGENILSIVKKNIGKDKTFTGVKLYSSLGFSPTDPILFDHPGLYSWCEKNKIPITIHFSNSGFASPAQKIKIFGDIYYPLSGEAVPAEDIYPDGIVTFNNSLFSINPREAVNERLLVLNHPKLWEKVLNKYPELTINFAHLGGFNQIPDYIKNKNAGFWTDWVLRIISEYKNVYTDLSGFADNQEKNDFNLSDFYLKIYCLLPESVKNKILYGSDYYILTLKEPDLSKYFNDFQSVFGKEINRIAGKNPEKFLGV